MDLRKIRKVNTNDLNLLNRCIKFCRKNDFDNLILLGDLHHPCIKLSDIYAILEENEDVKSVFTIFKGFENPSVIINVDCAIEDTYFIFNFIKEKIKSPFALISFTLPLRIVSKFFKILHASNEIYMRTNKQSFISTSKEIKDVRIVKVKVSDYESIMNYYEEIEAYPWNPIQLESNFYHYIELKSKIIACGGTHFETPALAHLGNIHVNPDYRRRGFGELLVSTVVSEILNEKQNATLFVQRDNYPAIQLYEKLGFHIYRDVTLVSCENI